MGIIYKWKCNKCGYTKVMSGGWDRGFFAETNTFQCNECKELMDVCIGQYPKNRFSSQVKRKPNSVKRFVHKLFPTVFVAEFTAYYNSLRVNNKIEEKNIQEKIHYCETCNNPLVLWNSTKKPCPKCNGSMGYEHDDLGILWD